MIAKILQPKNLTLACRSVVRNDGSAGVDNMGVTQLIGFIDTHRIDIVSKILKGDYIPNAIKGVEILKKNGKVRLLGVPTVVDRWLQQSVSRQLMTRFELDFEPYSFGFRPKKNIQQAVIQSLAYINDGYQDIVDIDLKGFFDEVEHYKLLQLIYDRVKCETTLRLIRKWLQAPILVDGKLKRRRKGVPQDEGMHPKGRGLIDL